MKQFLVDIFADAISRERRINVFSTPNRRTRRFEDPAEAAEYSQVCSDAGKNVYFGVALVHGDPTGRGRLQDLAAIGALWADIDVRHEVHNNSVLPESNDAAIEMLNQLPLKPSMIVDSGHGLHAYWLLSEPMVFADAVERMRAAALAKSWHQLVCSAAASRGWHLENLGDLTRVLRLPGTMNHKDAASPVPVRLIEAHPDRRYSPGDFEEYITPVSPQEAVVVGDFVLNPDAEPPADKLGAAVTESLQFAAAWERLRGDLTDQSQSGYDLSLASIAALRGWSDQEIADLIVAARRKHQDNIPKALRQDYMARTIALARAAATDSAHEGIDLSVLLPPPPDHSDNQKRPVDPGPLPPALLRIPGFVSEVMDYCLETAPYPNSVMAFCGALSLQAFLGARKVRDPGDNRTNLYLLGLAHSSAGKDWPRKVNTRILHEIGQANCLGDRFASGEGIQDALFLTPSMLFQTDEIDGMLQSINKAKDARHENIMGTLLTMYSSANSVFPMRRKAGKEAPGVIDQPCLVIFGTAIPNHYYEALSERMLTNGFFARMIVLEGGQRAKGQDARIKDLPPRVLETAKWWADFQPGERRGNLVDIHPIPAIVEQDDDARALLAEAREQADSEYAKAEADGDAVGTTVWGRVNEQIRKLALLYAISERHSAPRIGVPAVEWASAFVMHQTRRMLFMATSHVADNPFHAECLKAIEKLRDAPGRELPHSVLLKRMKMDARSFLELMNTLVQQGDVEVTTTPRPGWHVRTYRLASEASTPGETLTGSET